MTFWKAAQGPQRLQEQGTVPPPGGEAGNSPITSNSFCFFLTAAGAKYQFCPVGGASAHSCRDGKKKLPSQNKK